MNHAQMLKVLFDSGNFTPSFDFFEDNMYDLLSDSYMVDGYPVTPITFKDGSKAEYCDGDYTVKE